MKKTFQNKYARLRHEVECKIASLVEKKGKLNNIKTIKVKDEQMFNLSGSRYLTEVSSTRLIDNSGYEYYFEVLTMDQLCELVDSL